VPSTYAQAAPIPAEKIIKLEAASSSSKDESSPARKRLAVKRMIKDAGELLKDHATAPNRFVVLGMLLHAQKELVAADGSAENRAAFLETAKQLATAPDEYASLRFDADLLLSQSEMVRKGADVRARASALMPLVEKYRGTTVETKAVKVAIVMALEMGDTRLVNELQQVISERYAGDVDMIDFQRDKLGGQVIGAPFCGAFETSNGKKMRFPMDGLAKTTVLFFWSNDELSMKHLKAIAASQKEHQAESFGRIQVVSFNVDQLPDAGESILRGLGIDWPAIQLSAGRKDPHYLAFAAKTPALISLSASGQAALVMAGSTRNNNPKSDQSASDPDYTRLFTVEITREWTNPVSANRMNSLLSGEFLVLDPEGPLDPTRPPEMKAVASATPALLTRDASSVPEAKLLAIQDSFVSPPLRFSISKIEQKAHFEKTAELCAKVIAEHPQAPDLWMVRNRRIVALLGLWKLTSQSDDYDRAAAEAKLVLASKPPSGVDLLARYCLVRDDLRSRDANPKTVIADFLTSVGGEKASGPAMAAAAMLALEIGDRALHEELRKTILAQFSEQPMMWLPVSFMLCRYSRYWLYQVPFVQGWTYGRREDYFMSSGEPEDCKRRFTAEFQSLDGKKVTLPNDHAGKWTVLVINSAQQEDVSVQRMKTLLGEMKSLKAFIENRASQDVQGFTAFLDDDATKVGAFANEQNLGFPVLLVPGGLKNPIVQQLGVISENKSCNAVLLRPDGTIAAMLSGLAAQGRHVIPVLQNIIEWHDEKSVTDALGRNDIEEAKRIALLYAPTELPVSTNPKKKIIKPKPVNLPHLMSRARVYYALKEYDKALVDVEACISRQIGTDGGMSMRTKTLDDAEAFRDKLRELLGTKNRE
jgi:hypothetical protein